MKLSNYNFFYETETGILIYNTKSSAMAIMEFDNFNKLKRFINNNDEIDDNLFTEELNYGGFMIDDEIDELTVIRSDMYKDRFDEKMLSLTIAPTADCNFRCPYCYEKDVLQTMNMSDHVANLLVQFITEKIKTITKLNVSWYGGEPLLEINRIEELSNKFLKICDENKVSYSASIVTNGYLLTKNMMVRLINCKISSIQITLDGTEKIHDSRRYLKGNGKTYDVIKKNLLDFEELANSCSEFPALSIRTNIDRSNYSDSFNLLEEIVNSPISRYAVPYIAGVYDENDVDYSNTLSTTEYNCIKNQFFDAIKEKGFGVSYEAYYPKRITNNCGCDRYNSYVIAANGDIYKCWEEIGDKESCVGNLANREKQKSQLLYDYLTKDPTLDGKCKNCKILPVCMGGGCPHRLLKEFNKYPCESNWKEFGEKIVRASECLGIKIKKQISL